MKKLVVVGNSNMDTVIRVSHLPAAGETILLRSVESYYGGKYENQAVSIARLGGNVSMIGCVGRSRVNFWAVLGYVYLSPMVC